MKMLGVQAVGLAVRSLPAAERLARQRARTRLPHASHSLQLLAAKAMVLAWCGAGKAVVPMGRLLGAALWRVAKMTPAQAAAIVGDPEAALRASEEAMIATGLYPDDLRAA